MESPQLSLILPCLNEGRSLRACLTDLRAAMARRPALSWECLVVDNGSEDDSAAIALEEGCRLIRASPQGYGAALQAGIAAARAPWVVFLDADGTYAAEDLLPLFDRTREADAALGIASRFGRPLPAGAMPPLHRFLGTPILSWLIRRLFGGPVRDCNSGFRCLKRDRYGSWELQSQGMEFASELLVKALLAGDRVVEISSSLKPGPPGRRPALATWRDGMRHLLLILGHAPGFFERWGLLAVAGSLAGQIAAACLGPRSLGRVEILGIHSQLLLFGLGMLGIQAYATACSLLVARPSLNARFAGTRWLLALPPAELLITLSGLLVMGLLVFGVTVAFWAAHGFHGIDIAHWLVLLVELLSLPSLLAMVLLTAHLCASSRSRAPVVTGSIEDPSVPGTQG